MSTILDWFNNLPPLGLSDNGIKLIIYMSILFIILTAIIVFLSTKAYRKQERSMPLLDIDLAAEAEEMAVSIAPEEKIAVLKIEKSKYIAAQKALSEAHRKKEISENVFNRLSVRYASDLKRIEDAIEKATQELEVSRLEEELKKMQGDYLSKIKGGEPAIPATSTSTPTAPKPPSPVAPPAPTMPKAPQPPTPTAAPPPPSTVAKPSPPASVPKPPMPSVPSATPTKPAVGPTMPAPPTPAPKPPVTTTPTAQTAESSTDEGDLFAKSTSIAALRKEMLKELDRLKKFMSEQQ